MHTSVAVLAEISLQSPRKILICIICRIKVSQKLHWCIPAGAVAWSPWAIECSRYCPRGWWRWIECLAPRCSTGFSVVRPAESGLPPERPQDPLRSVVGVLAGWHVGDPQFSASSVGVAALQHQYLRPVSSVILLAKPSVTSPRELFIFVMKKNVWKIKAYQMYLIYFRKPSHCL